MSGLTVFLLLALGAWLVLAPWPELDSPVIRVPVDGSDPTVTASREPVAEPARAGNAVMSGSPSPAADVDPPADAVALETLPVSSEAEREQPVVMRSDRVALVAAPIGAVSEGGPHGALPRIARDGRKPWQVYARPIAKQVLAGAAPKVAIVLGGMGFNGELTQRAIKELPGEVSLAFAPYPDGLQRLVNQARAAGHETYLQLPMEPLGYPGITPGPRTLLAAMPAQRMLDNLAWFMGRFSGYVGVTNYMGAQLMSNPQALAPVMRELARRGLVFLDDGSLARSRAEEAGRSAGTLVKRADLMIDPDPSEAATSEALRQLEALAVRQLLIKLPAIW
jgi:uncharacterized protein